MADCAYTFKGPDGDYLTVTGIPGLKAYLVDGGLEHLFPERKFPLKAVSQLARRSEALGPLKDSFTSANEAEKHLADAFGPGIKTLVRIGVLRLTLGVNAWPAELRARLRGNEEAVYYKGIIYVNLLAVSRDRLVPVLIHELGEHFNLEFMLGAKEYASLQDQITNRAKIAGSQAEKVWNEVKSLYPELKVGSKEFVAEVIAKLGEANPKAPWYRRLLAKVKAFLVERGLGRGFIIGTMTEDDMHELLLTSLRSASGRFASGEPRLYSGDLVRASVPRNEFLSILDDFAKNDEVFKHPISDKKAIEDIMAEVAPAYSFDSRRSDLVSTDKVKTSVFVTPRKRLIFINESDGKVWLNVSKMKPGDAGGAIYAAVGNYAYNNGLKFIDDPSGLSEASVKRRPVHMLSLALKFGTTEFMDVSENFDALSKQLGLPELNWKNDYDSDLSSLIFRNVFYVYNALPELHRINYDFKTDGFRDDTGAVLPRVWARRLSRRDAARSNSIGESTIRRAVFLKSLASATGEEKSRLLENYRANGGLAGGVSLKGVFSRPSSGAEAFEQARYAEERTWLGDVKEKLRKSADTVQKQMLAFLGSNQMIEVMERVLPGLKAFGTLTNERAAKISDYRRKADRLLAVARTLKKPVLDRFNRIVNDSTDQDTNVAIAWEGIHRVENSDKEVYEVYTQDKLTADSRKKLNEYLMANLPPRRQLTDEFKQITRGKARIFGSRAAAEAYYAKLQEVLAAQVQEKGNAKINAENVERKQIHAKYFAEMQAMPEEAQKLYQSMHDLFEEVSQEKMQELIRRIEDGIKNKQIQKQMVAHMREVYESNSLTWYYSPLTRFGKYWYYGEIPDETGKMVKYREHFETEEALKNRVALFKNNGGRIIGQGQMLDNVRDLISVGAADTYTAGVQQIITDQMPAGPERDALQDAIYQFHLSHLPDVSMRHAQQHRKGVKGAETDVMRSFSSRMHHAASQVANMSYGAELETVIKDHEEMKRLWENPQYLEAEEDKLAAIDFLKTDWDTLGKPGEIESRMLKRDADKAMLTQAEKIVQLLGGTEREVKDPNGNSKGYFGIDAYTAEAELDKMAEKIRYIVKGSKRVRDEDTHLATNVIDELNLTFQAMMNTASSPFDQLAMQISNLNFFGMLGFGISSMAVNLLQVPNVVTPMLYGKFGSISAMKALTAAYKDFMSASVGGMTDADGNYSITELLDAKAKKLLDDAVPYGGDAVKRVKDSAEYRRLKARSDALNLRKQDDTITRTQTFDLVGVAENGLEKAGRLHWLATKSGAMFHHAERLNREVTLDAAFSLRYDQIMAGPVQKHYDESGKVTGDFSAAEMEEYAVNEAAEYARWVNDRANLNYSSDVAARIFRGPVARIALQFKKYQQGVIYNYVKMFMDAWKSVDRSVFPEGHEGDVEFEKAMDLKKESIRSFRAMVLIQTSFAGLLSLPFMGSLMAIYGMTGDDDEDKDLREDLLKGLAPFIGAEQALAVTNGFFDAYSPIPLSRRLDLADLFFREPMGGDEALNPSTQYLVQLLGPTGGSIQNVAMAGKLMSEGEVWKGTEKLLPKAAGDLFKGMRYYAEGATNMKGYQQKEMDAFESFIAAIGFGNSELNKQRLEMNMAKGDETAIQNARKELVSDLGWQMANDDVLDTDKLDEWNEKHPEMPITMDSIMKSAKGVSRVKEERSMRGYTINPKLEYLAEESDLFEDED